jgi:predicted nucleic acid-binding protein
LQADDGFARLRQERPDNGLLVDTNLLVLLIVGSVNRDRVSQFKRTTAYSSADWDLLIGILEQISQRYTLPHVLAEVSALTDLRGPELETARTVLHKLIGEMRELNISSADACATSLYLRLGLTDAAIAEAARLQGCSVLTNDSVLYAALADEGSYVAMFNHFRDFL